MKTVLLDTSDPLVRLVEPDVERDAALGVQWLQGETGRDTLRQMGVAVRDNLSTDLAKERDRVGDFVSNPDQLNWMIQYDCKVVGSIWVDLKEKEGLPAPAVHIMIGDPGARGKGIGSTSMESVISYLDSKGYSTVFSRHLANNNRAAKLLEEQGFEDMAESYLDQEGLTWQNMKLKLE